MGARSGCGTRQDGGNGARESDDAQDPQTHESSPFSRTGCPDADTRARAVLVPAVPQPRRRLRCAGTPRAGTSSGRARALRQNCRQMAHALIAYLAAAVVAASHVGRAAERRDGGSRGAAAARQRRPPRRAGRPGARSRRAARPARRPARVRRRRRPRPLGRGDRRGAAERPLRLGRVRSRRLRSAGPVDAPRLALPACSSTCCEAGRLVRTIPVGIGAPGSPTPTGRFADRREGHGPLRPGLRSAASSR